MKLQCGIPEGFEDAFNKWCLISKDDRFWITQHIYDSDHIYDKKIELEEYCERW